MITIEASLLSLVLVLTSLTATAPPLVPDVPFDQYGSISWEDEQARLDNLAIQLEQFKNMMAYILVVDAVDGCPGEAQARAIRAKRYLVEHRGIANNRLIWRVEGFRDQPMTTLLVAPPEYTLFHGYGATMSGKSGPLNKLCKLKLARIRKSRW